MSVPVRLAHKLRPLWSCATHARSFSSKTLAEEWPQRTPLGSYYETILHKPTQYRRPEAPASVTDSTVPPPPEKEPAVEKQPLPEKKPAPEKKPSPKKQPVSKKNPSQPKATPKDTSTKASAAPSFTSSTLPSQTPEERMRSIFGSRVLSPEEIAARLATKESQSTYIAGILVPPQPKEPDNCCMSGCVNCVWERYREDMEEWSAKKNEAQSALAAQSVAAESDTGGVESKWRAGAVPGVGDTKIAKDLWADDVFESVPVGIREFMKQEKRIKERHGKEDDIKN